MCLGVPGKIIEIHENTSGLTMGRVSFAGVIKEVCLAYVPEAKVGDYVIVHVGFAISKVAEDEAQEIFRYLREMNDLADLDLPQGDAAQSPSV
jgi:hydrogenase expression/formation protein HypC